MTTLDRDYLQEYPHRLIDSLSQVGRNCRVEMYVTGGAVRDWLRGANSQDLDVTVSKDALRCARLLAAELRGAFVPLDEVEEVARVVWQGFSIDFSIFRESVVAIEEDLGRRDFTINALAVAFDPEKRELVHPYLIIDPTNGISDIQNGIVRATSEAVFANDPLRLLRAYRFAAVFGFSLAEDTEQAIRQQVSLLDKVSPERISYELEKIIGSARSHDILGKMAEIGLLWIVFPELKKGVGVRQPASHHLDVFFHNLETLLWMERIQKKPDDYFSRHGKQMEQYLADGKRKNRLRWAALFHDLGKPDAHAIINDRITFYNHDQTGARLFEQTAKRLRWSREDTKQISQLIALHMWPFHLNNARLKNGITVKACLRLIKTIGEDFPGLFLLAMADSLAGQGLKKPPDMEKSLTALYEHIDEVYQKNIKPVLKSPRLLTGHDLERIFDLTPGPIFKKILTGLEKAQVAKEVKTRQEAVNWVSGYLERQ